MTDRVGLMRFDTWAKSRVLKISSMQPVSDEIVEAAWQEIGGIDDERKIEFMMDEFDRTQPAIAEYVAELSQRFSDQGADLVYFASLVIWRSYLRAWKESRGKQAFPTLQPEDLVENTSKVQKWLESMEGYDEILLEKKLRDPKSYTQPFLMRYVTEAILDSHEDGMDLSPEELHWGFIGLKAVVDSFEKVIDTPRTLH